MYNCYIQFCGEENPSPGKVMELQVTLVAVLVAFLVWDCNKVAFVSHQCSKCLTQQGFRIVSVISWAEFG